MTWDIKVATTKPLQPEAVAEWMKARGLRLQWAYGPDDVSWLDARMEYWHKPNSPVPPAVIVHYGGSQDSEVWPYASVPGDVTFGIAWGNLNEATLTAAMAMALAFADTFGGGAYDPQTGEVLREMPKEVKP